jgi:hypothetical protein
MITIEYTKYGTPVSDFETDKWMKMIVHCQNCDCDKLNKIPDFNFCVSTSILFSVIRLAIVKGELDYKQIKFKFEDKIISINEYGAITDWPNGFADLDISLSQDILQLAMKKRKNEKEKQNE